MQPGDFARQLRNDTTIPERALWEQLRRRSILGCRFRRQFRLGKYIVDFVSLERRLIVEVDGAFHNQQQSKDQERTAWLESQGYRVLRFWNGEVITDMAGVLEGIFQALKDAPPRERPVRVRAARPSKR
ncbi:MAG: endonuclease domain-containing protein [Planctomycetales bacterium]